MLRQNLTGQHALPSGLHVMPMDKAILKLKRLKEAGVDLHDRPETLLSTEIDTLENVFQARSGKLNERHLGDLEAAIRTQGTVEPLILWRCGGYSILLEGHHRLEAYQRVEKQRGALIPIPVTWFEGTVEEAVIKASSANSRAKLPMSSTEKLDHAWKLVLSETFSLRQIIDAASVSRRTVNNMRSVMKKLGRDAHETKSWRSALSRAQGFSGWDQDDADALVEAQAKEWADRLAKEFSTKLAHQPEIAAKALAIYFNRVSSEVIKAWASEIGGLPQDDDEEVEEVEEDA